MGNVGSELSSQSQHGDNRSSRSSLVFPGIQSPWTDSQTMSSLILILLVTSTSTSTTSSSAVEEKPWSWAEERAGDTIQGRFVSEEIKDQVRTLVDPVLGNVETSQPRNDNVLRGFFVQEDSSEVQSEEGSDYQEYHSEHHLLTGEEAELTDFIEEHQYDYQDQIALPQTAQVVLPAPPPPHLVPQLHPPQHHVQHHQHQQRHPPVHQRGNKRGGSIFEQ